MKTALIVILSVLLFCGLLVAGFYAFFMYSLNNMKKKQTIAKNVQITSEWLELKPDKPLDSTKNFQKILLSIENYTNNHKDYENIRLKDGTNINPEIEIIDENGKVYHLEISGRVNDDVKFDVNEKLDNIDSLPQNVKYKIIRIRSDKPFLCKKIYWYDYNLK